MKITASIHYNTKEEYPRIKIVQLDDFVAIDLGTQGNWKELITLYVEPIYLDAFANFKEALDEVYRNKILDKAEGSKGEVD